MRLGCHLNIHILNHKRDSLDVDAGRESTLVVISLLGGQEKSSPPPLTKESISLNPSIGKFNSQANDPEDYAELRTRPQRPR